MNFFNIATNIITGEKSVYNIKELLRGHKSCLFVSTSINGIQKETFYEIINLIKKENIKVTIFDKVIPNPPTKIIEEGINLIKENNIDCIVGLGGGSTLDTAKAIRLLSDISELNWEEICNEYNNPFYDYNKLHNNNIKLIAIPTTTGTGSEVTQAAVLTHNELKYTIFHKQNFPDYAILDPNLVVSLPRSITSSTSFDAFTHAYESFISPNSNDITKIYSIMAIDKITKFLPKCLEDLNDLSYRNELLIAQNFAGIALANGGAHLPHPLSEVIGSYSKIPHGDSLAAIFHQYLKEFEKEQFEQQKLILEIFNKNLNKNFSDLSEAVCYFIDYIGLKNSLNKFNIDEEIKNKITNDKLWSLLPFAKEQRIKNLLIYSFDN